MASEEKIMDFKLRSRARNVQYDAIKPGEYGDISGVVVRDRVDPWKDVQSNPVLEHILNLVMAWSSDRYREAEFISAKSEFDLLMGKTTYDEVSFHPRMEYFQNYFCFQRPVMDAETAQGRTPFEDLLENSDAVSKLDLPVLAAIKKLREYRHSIFVIDKMTPDGFRVKDLFADQEKVFVKKNWQGMLTGYAKNSVLQGFIFPSGEDWELSSGVIEHSSSVKRWIGKRVKESLKSRDHKPLNILSELARKHLNSTRWRHGDIVELYSRD